MKSLHRSVLAVTALAVAALLSACTGAGAPTATSAAPTAAGHNSADTTFAQMMTVHHKGAIEMSDLAPTRAASPDVKKLAETIKAAQKPEIDRMTSWLKEWKEPESMEGMDMSTSMPGMSKEDMSTLTAASGTSFDRQFLTLMTQHHQGAVTMAEDELAKGDNAQAKKLAQSIIDSQTKEIAEMKDMLSTLG